MIRKIQIPTSNSLVCLREAATSSLKTWERIKNSLASAEPFVSERYNPMQLKDSLPLWKERLAKNFILSKIHDTISISDVAAACSLSRSHFSRAFKKSTGFSPQQWVIHVRIEKAQLLLEMSDLTLTEVGLECGFSDQSHFTKTFSKHLGVPPKTWRRTNWIENINSNSAKHKSLRISTIPQP